MTDYSTNLLQTVHESVPLSKTGKVFYCKGEYEYWHYNCDGFNDQGWGCGYRTLQTISSWIIKNQKLNKSVPSIREVQQVLVNLEDKERNFIGSRQWIGSFEVCLVLDTLYNIPSKVIHMPNLENLITNKKTFINHFENCGSPVMMGGDKDCSSKCIVGVLCHEAEFHLLIVDPHFVGKAKKAEELIKKGYLYWKNVNDLNQDSFYNVCFPQTKFDMDNKVKQ